MNEKTRITVTRPHCGTTQHLTANSVPAAAEVDCYQCGKPIGAWSELAALQDERSVQ